jgi:large subunit ribosomal protein L18
VIDDRKTAGGMMSTIKVKNRQRQRRKLRVRKQIYGTPDCPRLSVFRSSKNIYAQLIDDTTGSTLAEASTRARDLQGSLKYGGNVAAATQVGKLLADRALARGVKRAVFDRNGYRFHGRVKAMADAVREAGLKI